LRESRAKHKHGKYCFGAGWFACNRAG
jgi:hypothetical protein